MVSDVFNRTVGFEDVNVALFLLNTSLTMNCVLVVYSSGVVVFIHDLPSTSSTTVLPYLVPVVILNLSQRFCPIPENLYKNTNLFIVRK